jgi:HPt (histidine-containing phosphotransfer) domain-containing protein
MDRDELAETLGFSRSDVDMLMDMFLKNAHTSLDQMEMAIGENDIKAVGFAAHAIKGIAGNLKMDDIFELSKEIDLMAKTWFSGDFTPFYLRLKEMIEGVARS